MKYIFLLLLLISTSSVAFEYEKLYIKVGTGYKVMEPSGVYIEGVEYDFDFGHPLTARIEFAYEYSETIQFGIAHHSQWLDGWPVNSYQEYHKTELFIDYKFSFKNL
jgi:hypothetical protein